MFCKPLRAVNIGFCPIRNPVLYPFELRALASVFISLPASAAPEAVTEPVPASNSLSQLAHRILNFHVVYIDVTFLGPAHIAVTQYALDQKIIDARFL